MTSSPRATRLSPDQTHALTLARLDYSLSEGPLAQGTRMDPRIVDPHLDELVRERAERAESEARELGYAAGYREARHEIAETIREELGRENDVLRAEHEALIANQAELRNQLDDALRIVRGLAVAMDDAAAPVYEAVGHDLASVVVALVEDLLGRSLEADGAHVVGAITQAVAEIPKGTEITVRLHPDDAALLNRFDVDLEAAVGRIVHTELDASIERHGVVVVSGSTSVDAQIKTRLDRLREVLGE